MAIVASKRPHSSTRWKGSGCALGEGEVVFRESTVEGIDDILVSGACSNFSVSPVMISRPSAIHNIQYNKI